MRVTDRSRIAAMLQSQNAASARFDKAARVASSGQRVTKPSDDPAAYGSLVRRNYALAMLDEHSRTADRARGELEVVQNVLATGVDLLVQAREAAVNGANSTSDGTARKTLAENVRAIRNELMSIANTRYGDKYLFGGTRTDAIPFDPTTGAFLGNDQVVRVPVLEGVTPPSNISGAQTFTAAGGRDIFADLDRLATALDANDEDGIRATIDALTAGHDQLISAQVQAGFGAERFRNAVDVLVSTKSAVTERLSAEIEGDPTSQLTELTLARTAYERSVAVTRQLLAISTNSS